MSQTELPTIQEGWPTREQLLAVWEGVALSAVSRADAHNWSRRWVEGSTSPSDPLISIGLTYVHGIDLVEPADGSGKVRHGGPGGYSKTPADIRSDIEYWLASCAEYDIDPIGWMANRMARARDAVREWKATRDDGLIK